MLRRKLHFFWVWLIGSKALVARMIGSVTKNSFGTTCSMLLVVSLQLGAIAVTALLAGLLGGLTMALSALLGGLIVIAPNLLFAWQLHRVNRKDAFPAAFLAGEALKIFLTIAMLLAVIRSGIQFNWPMLVGAMGIALFAPFLGWFFENPDAAEPLNRTNKDPQSNDNSQSQTTQADQAVSAQ